LDSWNVNEAKLMIGFNNDSIEISHGAITESLLVIFYMMWNSFYHISLSQNKIQLSI
jgi:hypothetical protein